VEGRRQRSSGLVGWMSDRTSHRPRAKTETPWPPLIINAVNPEAGPIERMDAKQVWRAALGELQVSLSPANYETWLRDTQLVDVDEQRFRIAVPNGFAKDWLETRYRSLISQTLARIVGYSVQVEFVVGPAPTDGTPPVAADDAPPVATPSRLNGQEVRVEATRIGGEGGATNLNPRYTFANFIVGSANRLGHAASLSVAERPGHAYNPLFLYGGVGLGKTHLMHAIGNQVIARFPRKRVVYATSEKFTNEFITSIQQGKIDEFRSRYRRIDLLLIDDIQFIADKERTQEEFFHTFNAIHEDGKQIVLSSDRPPKAILTLEERLRSRFEWGLIADLTAPDLETRIAILRAKAEEGAVPITSDVVEFIARKVVSNVRELEGALNRIVAFASMGATPISIELAQAVLSNVLYNPKKRQVTPERIAKAVSDYYSVPMEALQGQKRDKAIVMPRQIAMFLMREETDVSLLRIGAELGNRDHSTVLHACDKITREIANNDELRREIAAVRELIYAE
jgi:chromosomal replication initiator protein